jgi:hypothetical protein
MKEIPIAQSVVADVITLLILIIGHNGTATYPTVVVGAPRRISISGSFS